MALQFSGVDPRDNFSYPTAYAKFSFLARNRRLNTLEIWFNLYESQSIRLNSVINFYDQVKFKLESPDVSTYLETIPDMTAAINTLITDFITAQGLPVYDSKTNQLVPDAVQVWKILCIDPVSEKIAVEVDAYRNQELATASENNSSIQPCARPLYFIRKDAQGLTPSYADFLATNSTVVFSLNNLIYNYAKTQTLFSSAVDLLDPSESTTTTTTTTTLAP